MGFYLPETASAKSDLTAKNRVWGFFAGSDLVSLESRHVALEKTRPRLLLDTTHIYTEVTISARRDAYAAAIPVPPLIKRGRAVCLYRKI